MKPAISFLAALLLAPVVELHATEIHDPQFTDVFVSGKDGYPNYRIPSLVVTARGTLLAVCEGRTKNNDHAANDLVLKRSGDGGQSWSPLRLVRDEGDATCNDPVMTVLESGRVLLFFARFPAEAHTKEVVPGWEGKVSRHFVMHSDDEGTTWSTPREVTRMVKLADAQASSQGAGIGMQLKSGAKRGRILIPMWQRIGEGDKVEIFAYVAYSDDGGDSWHRSEPVPHGRGDGRPWHNISEAALIELNDGRVMMNGRNANGPFPFHRKLSFSADGGETWTECREEKQLPEPQCQAGLIRVQVGDASALLFANPNSQDGRKNGTVRLSRDEGRTWPHARVLMPGAFRYNCLSQLPDGTLLCLFEHGPTKTPKITLARFHPNWVIEPLRDF